MDIAEVFRQASRHGCGGDDEDGNGIDSFHIV